MWFYLYLLTTTLHLQYGWTSVRLFNEPALDALDALESQWDFKFVYIISRDHIETINDLIVKKVHYYESQTNRNWYLEMNPSLVESMMDGMDITYEKITIH